MLLEIKDLHCSYRAAASLREVSLTMKKGKVVALIGANGAGRSTLLRAVSGLIHPVSGEITGSVRTCVQKHSREAEGHGMHVMSNHPSGKGAHHDPEEAYANRRRLESPRR
jgi:ABC-type branched-subunit amino acid transport system ATPase component